MSAKREEPPTGNDERAAELLREAERLQRSLDANQRTLRRRQKRSAAGRAERYVTGMHGALLGVVAASGWLYVRVLRPIAGHPWVRAPLRGYGRLWNRAVYVTDADGDRVLSERRAGAMVLATLAALWFAPAILGVLGELVWDAAWMAGSYRTNEVWYLGRSQEIDPDGNVFSAQGCESITCTDQTSIYFRIKPSLAHHVWSLFRNGNVFFPDFVAAGIQNDVNKCHATVYGARMKFLVRNWDIYPQILSVECVPLTDGEIQAMEQARRGP